MKEIVALTDTVEFIVIVSSAGATSAADTGVTRRAVHNTIPLKK